ncbi:mandelate racemase/muconate lactonizing enzyme family protein [Candidatus Latescibacterota bacterium]
MTTRRKLLSLGGIFAAAAVHPISPSVAQKVERSKPGNSPLKITKVEPIVYRFPMDDTPPEELIVMPPIGAMKEGIGLWNRLDHASPSRFKGYQQTTLVKITTDQGIIGWGECHAPAAPHVHKKVITDLLAPIILGQDARNIEVLWEKMYSSQRLRGYTSGFYTESIAGVDIALWDIFGKYVDLPVFQLLGGKYRDRIPTYCSGGSRSRAQKALDEGFTVIKMGLNKGAGTGDFQRVVEVSETMGDKGQVLIDSLGAFKLHEATKVGKELDKLGNIGWFEDALMPEDSSGYPILAQEIDTAICAGEGFTNRFQFRDMFTKRALDIINPDVSRAGGITECKRIADLADIFGVLFSPHVSTGLPPYVAASIHLAAATPNSVIMEGGNIYGSTSVSGSKGNVLLKEPLEFHPGYVVVPERPGLGIEFDEKELAKVTIP